MKSDFPLLVPLSAERTTAADALRQHLYTAFSAFEFVVLQLPEVDGDPTEAHHRAAVQLLFEQVGAGLDAPLECDVSLAVPMALDASAVLRAERFPPGHRVTVFRKPGSVSWFEWLAQAFDDPPYRLQVADAELHASLFPSFCACTGLLPDENITVLDWVGDPDREPERSTWSPYFDDGKEWWGIWCLTIWNPRRRTLAALAASTTD